MLDTDYNRKISQQIEEINRKYIAHSRKIGLGTQKGLLRVVGAGDYKEELNVDRVGGRRRIGKAITGGEETQMEGKGILDTIGHVAEMALPLLALGKKKSAKRISVGKGETGGKATGVRKKKENTKNIMVEVDDIEGDGKKKKKNVNKGGNIFDTIGHVAEMALPLLALGKKKQSAKRISGKGITGGTAETGGRKKQSAKRISVGKGATGGTAETGGRKKISPWITHVKKFAKKHKMKYNEALKDPKCKASYK